MKLVAKKRKILGKKVKTLRHAGTLPAVIFGGKEDSTPIELAANEFKKVYAQAGESTLFDLEIDGKNEKVLVSEVQHDPLGKLLHADLRRVLASEKITAAIPLVIEGESRPVKSGEGVLLTLLPELEVECLPQDLPHEIKVDLSPLTEVGQGVTVSQLPIDQEKVKVIGHEPEELVVKVDYPQVAEVEEAPVSEEEAIAAVEATEEKKPEEEIAEGEAPQPSTEKKEEKEKEPK